MLVIHPLHLHTGRRIHHCLTVKQVQLVRLEAISLLSDRRPTIIFRILTTIPMVCNSFTSSEWDTVSKALE